MALKLVVEATTGTIELTPFLDVQAGKGMDPADPQFTNKIFAHSLLKVGGTLALEQLKLRELTFPLIFKDTTKNKLTAKVRELDTIINTAGGTVEWQDEGATVPTYFTLVSGQCDPEFDFRQGQQTNPILKAKLRLFVQPLGLVEKTARPMLMAGTEAAHGATLSGTQPVMTFYSASGIRGDAAALLEGTVTLPSQSFYAAFSVLPGASYAPWCPATNAETTKTGWTASGAGAEGLLAVGIGNTIEKGIYIKRGAGNYVGTQRVLAMFRRVNAATDVKAGVEIEGEYESHGSLLAANDPIRQVDIPNNTFQLIDLGVVHKASMPNVAWNLVITTTGSAVFGGLAMLPENNTSFYSGGAFPGQLRIDFSGPLNTVAVEANGYQEVTGQARGAIPKSQPGPAQPTYAFLSAQAGNAVAFTRSMWVNVLEQSRYVFSPSKI